MSKPKVVVVLTPHEAKVLFDLLEEVQAVYNADPEIGASTRTLNRICTKVNGARFLAEVIYTV